MMRSLVWSHAWITLNWAVWMWFVPVHWEKLVHPRHPGVCCWAAGDSLQGQAGADLHLLSPSQKRQWDGHALCGWKGGSIAKANCGLSSGGSVNGRHRVSLPGCAGSCLWDRADLTCLALNTLLQHDLHRIAVLEHLVLPQLSRWRLKSQSPSWYQHCDTHPTSHKSPRSIYTRVCIWPT